MTSDWRSIGRGCGFSQLVMCGCGVGPWGGGLAKGLVLPDCALL